MYNLLKKKEEESKMNSKINEFNNNNNKILKEIFDNIEISLKKICADNPGIILKNKDFRNKYSALCFEAGIDPLVAKRGYFSDITEFYNNLSIKLLHILNKIKDINGGITDICHLENIYNKNNNYKIDKTDIINSLKHLEILGYGCSIIDNKYININHFFIEDEYFKILKISEKHGFVNSKILKKELNMEVVKFNHIIVP